MRILNSLNNLELTFMRCVCVRCSNRLGSTLNDSDLFQTTRLQISTSNISTHFVDYTVKVVRNLLAGRSTIGLHHKITLDLGGFGPVFIHAHVVEGKILISHRNIVRIVQLLGNSEITQIRSIDIVHSESLNLISRNLHRLRRDVRRTGCVLHISRISTLGNLTLVPNRNLRGRHFTGTINSQGEL